MISSCFVNRCCVTLQVTANCCHLMVVEGGNVLHHVKERGHCPGNCPGTIYPEEYV